LSVSTKSGKVSWTRQKGKNMASIQQLSDASGVRVGALVLGVTPSTKHRVLLSSYLLNLWRGPEVVRDMIVADVHAALDVGASALAADLLLVLRQFLDSFPEVLIEAESSTIGDRNRRPGGSSNSVPLFRRRPSPAASVCPPLSRLRAGIVRHPRASEDGLIYASLGLL
jgi:hypothetical protein